jgi:hypothetical protein
VARSGQGDANAASLREEQRPESRSRTTDADLQERPAPADAGFFGDRMKRMARFFAEPTPLSLAVAFLVISGVVVSASLIYLKGNGDRVAGATTDPPPGKELVAHISDMGDCNWGTGGIARRRGDILSEGDVVELEKGFVELTFESDAVALLQGPVRFRVDSAGSATLMSGKVTAHVVPSAAGFTVRTKNADIVDLGTQFGVFFDDRSATHAYVQEGRVDVHFGRDDSGERFTRRLFAGDTIWILPDGTPHPEAVLRDRPLAYWRLNESSGRVAKDASGGGYDGKYVGAVTLGKNGPLLGGRSRAATFDGRSGYVSVPPLGSARAVTFEAWVRLTALPAREFGAVLSHEGSTGKSVGDIHWHFDMAGRNRVEIKDHAYHHCFLSEPMALRTWVHLVLIYESKERRMRLFINGELSDSALVGRNTIARLGPSVIGGGYRPERKGHWLEGQIAEVAVYDVALSPERIVEHHRLARDAVR